MAEIASLGGLGSFWGHFGGLLPSCFGFGEGGMKGDLSEGRGGFFGGMMTIVN